MMPTAARNGKMIAQRVSVTNRGAIVELKLPVENAPPDDSHGTSDYAVNGYAYRPPSRIHAAVGGW